MKKNLIFELGSYVVDQAKKTYLRNTAAPDTCGACPFHTMRRHPIGVALTMCTHPMRSMDAQAVSHEDAPLDEECPLRRYRSQGGVLGEALHHIMMRQRPASGPNRLGKTFLHIRRLRDIIWPDPERERPTDKPEGPWQEPVYDQPPPYVRPEEPVVQEFETADLEEKSPSPEPKVKGPDQVDPALKAKYADFFANKTQPSFYGQQPMEDIEFEAPSGGQEEPDGS